MQVPAGRTGANAKTAFEAAARRPQLLGQLSVKFDRWLICMRDQGRQARPMLFQLCTKPYKSPSLVAIAQRRLAAGHRRQKELAALLYYAYAVDYSSGKLKTPDEQNYVTIYIHT